MDISADSLDPYALKALLDWQAELGADEPMGDSPINRYEAPKETRRKAQAAPPSPLEAPDQAALAQRAADDFHGLEDLRNAMSAFEGCDLRKGARNLVFADGQHGARVMLIGEAPGRDEDMQGLPFVGRAGQLLDRMLAAIGLSRAAPDPASAVYITNVLPWRPPQNRTPSADEIAMMIPFLRRHIALADPEVLVVMGNASCLGVLGRKGITGLRGKWCEAEGRPCLPMFHPAYLLRNPAAKREAWADLLSLRAYLSGQNTP